MDGKAQSGETERRKSELQAVDPDGDHLYRYSIYDYGSDCLGVIRYKKHKTRRKEEGTIMKTLLQIKKLQMRQILNQKLKELLSEEGDTNFVSIILIMVIVIAIAVIFQEQLTEAVEAVFEKLTDFIG